MRASVQRVGRRQSCTLTVGPGHLKAPQHSDPGFWTELMERSTSAAADHPHVPGIPEDPVNVVLQASARIPRGKGSETAEHQSPWK